MEIIKSAKPEMSEQPVVLCLIDVKGKTGDELNEIVAAFYRKWERTHVLSAPDFLIGNNGEERLFMRAVDRTLWLKQNEDQGVAQARAQIAGQAEVAAFQSGKIALASAVDLPSPRPTPNQQPRGGGMRGAFPSA